MEKDSHTYASLWKAVGKYIKASNLPYFPPIFSNRQDYITFNISKKKQRKCAALMLARAHVVRAHAI